MTSFESQNKASLNNGIYTFSDIAKILGIPRYKVDMWVNKYWDGRLGKEFEKTYSWKIERSKAVNFYTLIEFYVLIKMAEEGISTKLVLTAHKELTKIHNTMYPFAHKVVLDKICSDGKKLLYDFGEEIFSLDGSRRYQFDFMRMFFHHLDFDDNSLVSKFWPLGKEKNICVDPKHQFGYPVINKTNIYPETINNLFQGGESKEFIADEYGIEIQSVDDAISFCNAS